MKRWLEKLNTPKAVVVVLAICLPVDGFLLYEYRAAVEEASRPEAAAGRQLLPPRRPRRPNSSPPPRW